MKRILLISLLALVLGYSGCSNDGTNSTPSGAGGTGGADGTGGAGGGDGAGGTSEPAAPTTVSGQVGDDGFHVWLNAPAGGDGSSWGQAYSDLQPAIDAAEADSTKKKVYVTQGTYKPTSCPDQANGECAAGDDKDRKKHFALKNDVEVYGGYSGQGNTRTDNPSLTILSGDLGDNDTADETTKTDNVYHVFYHPSSAALPLTDKAKLHNVTITKGNASSRNGGGMYNHTSSNPSLTNVTFSRNTATNGGGMFNHTSSNPSLTNVTFSRNTATSSGGGMYNYKSSPTLTDVNFTSNTAPSGGGMFNYDNSNLTLTGVTFEDNTATDSGGGMANYSSSPELTSVTFKDNTATDSGGGMHNFNSSSPTLNTVTFKDNTAKQSGGGMSNSYNSSPTFKTVCIFTGNMATGDDGKGGAIYDSNDSTINSPENAKDGGGKEITSITDDNGKDNGYYKQ